VERARRKRLEVQTGQAQIHRGLPVRFVHAQEETLRFGPVFCVEALELFGAIVERLVNALATEERAITIFHQRYRA
jgi:hypothetical protein